jgi:phosphohistidine phosphatase SixA
MITVLLVRHADIDLPARSGNPSLNSAGRARAETLAQLVGSAGITTVFTSSLLRTKQTVEPVVARLGLSPREAPAPDALAQEVASGADGGVVLIAGHSNTVPEMITALGVPPPAPVIDEREFDNLFVVTVAKPGEAGAIRLKYGKPSIQAAGGKEKPPS